VAVLAGCWRQFGSKKHGLSTFFTYFYSEGTISAVVGYLERKRFVHKYIFHSRVQINLYMHCNMIYGDGKCIFVQEIANAYIYTVYIQATHGPGGLWECPLGLRRNFFAFFLRNAAASWYV